MLDVGSKLDYEMSKAIEDLVNEIKSNYYKYTSRNGTRDLTDFNKRMIDTFNANIEVNVGNKYIKIIQNHSVWGFVVNTDNDKKFQRGDILKAAGWAGPARNFARGNVLTGVLKSTWTGA